MLKQVVVLLIGIPVLLLGLVLLPLPGPGLLVMLLGLFILSLEFEAARTPLQKVKQKLTDIIKKYR
jgi:uncharacterized protein (TIGR02611 family)